MKKKGDPDGREEGVGAKKGERVKNKVVEPHNNVVNNISEDGAQNGTNSNGHPRHANGCGQRTTGSLNPTSESHHPSNGSHQPTNGSYANPLNASALPTHTSASHLLPTYPWDNESDEER